MLKVILVSTAIALLGTQAALAQQPPTLGTSAPGIKRTPLQKFDVPGTNHETVIGIAEIAPNASIGRHTHPGPESGYVLDGDFVLLVEGQPDRSLKVGESYQVPAGAVHDAKASEKGAK